MGDEWVLVVVVLVIIFILANNNNIRKSIEFSSPTGFVKIQCPTGVINASNFTGEFPLWDGD